MKRWHDPLAPDRHLEPDPLPLRIAMMEALIALCLAVAVALILR